MSSFSHHLNQLRQASESKRERVRLAATIGITAVVAIIWFSTLSLRLSQPTETQLAKSEKESSVFGTAVARVGAGWAVVKGALSD